jgi:hypothetical protein
MLVRFSDIIPTFLDQAGGAGNHSEFPPHRGIDREVPREYDKGSVKPSLTAIFIPLLACSSVPLMGEIQEVSNNATLSRSATEHFREELGVNKITTPPVGKVFSDLEVFQPPPLDLVRSFDMNRSYPDRFQTALQFGSLVANGFVATIARQKQLVNDAGRALIREANVLGAGKRLTSRSKSLLELSDRGDWAALRKELDATQEDVETSMIELKDGEIADLVSLGGWLRGFQLASHVTADHYTPAKAGILVRPAVMDYFIDRMDCLNPSMKKRPAVAAVAASLKEIRALALRNDPPTEQDVAAMRDLADRAMKEAFAREIEFAPATQH